MAQTVLNREEAELDLCISKLHDTIKQEIFSVGFNAPDAENPRSLQAKLQANMTQLRARMRELELLADEQETCVFWLVANTIETLPATTWIEQEASRTLA